MIPGLQFLRVDTIIQRILAAFYLSAGLATLIETDYVIFLMIVQFFLGGWQVLSSIILIAIRRDQKRINYLLVVLGYFLLVFVGGMLVSNAIIRDGQVLMFLGFILCPMTIAVWYFIRSEMDYQLARESSKSAIVRPANENEKILDEGLWE